MGPEVGNRFEWGILLKLLRFSSVTLAPEVRSSPRKLTNNTNLGSIGNAHTDKTGIWEKITSFCFRSGCSVTGSSRDEKDLDILINHTL